VLCPPLLATSIFYQTKTFLVKKSLRIYSAHLKLLKKKNNMVLPNKTGTDASTILK